ncbi:MAG: M23 family metallopeptidase [Pseudomonadota bacterium]
MYRTGLAVILSRAAYPAAGDGGLQMPVDCTLGESCYIQHLPDRDPGPETRDFLCGGLTYDGHGGTDFALPTYKAMAAGVDVLAAADGVVKGIRDEMPDQLYTPDHDAQISGRDCGNGVLIDHEDGWQTQYCHLKLGSVAVQPGDRVTTGEALGQIGLSGKTQFPHMHLSVRKNGTTIDPFLPSDAACGTSGADLWATTPQVSPGGLIYAGFAPGLPEFEAIKAGTADASGLMRDVPALVLFGFTYGSQTGDILRLEITGPNGPFLEKDIVLPKPQAQLFRAAGRRLTEANWSPGHYTGVVTMLRGEEILARQQVTTEVR